MKLEPYGASAEKRLHSLVLTAQSEIEAAVLYAHFQELRREPLDLTPWQHEALDLIRRGENTALDCAQATGNSLSNMSNRLVALCEMGLLARRKEALPESRSRWVYSLNIEWALDGAENKLEEDP